MWSCAVSGMGNEQTYENGEVSVEVPSGDHYRPIVSPMGTEPVRIDWKRGELTGTIRTDIEFEGEGAVYGVETVQHGKRRIDWKMGHIDGTYAEGWDCYYEGKLFYRTEFSTRPSNGQIGKYEDDTFYELIERDADGADEYADGENASNWVIQRFGTSIIEPETRLEEWYQPAWESEYGES